MKKLLYILVLSFALLSCKTVYVPVEKVHTEYRYRDSIRFDSIYQYDSIYHYVEGDIQYFYKYKFLYKYLMINKVDTFRRIDSIQVPVIVEKPLTKWQNTKIELGGWVFGAFLALALFIVIRFIYGRFNK